MAEYPEPRDASGVSPDEFRSMIANSYEPLVLRGLAKEWAIVSAASESPHAVSQYLKRFDTGQALPMIAAPAATGGRMFYNDSYDGFNFDSEQATLSDGLDRMLGRSSSAGEPYRFFQCLPVTRAMPRFVDEIYNPLVPPDTQPGIWIGTQITVAAHFDESKNIAVVAAGRRRFTLFPPEQVANLYVGRLDFTPAGQPISLAKPEDPDFERHPRYRKALDAALSIELAPGDAIYIPTPWWHHVESLEPLNVLVNYWWDGARAASALPFTALVHAMQAFRHMPPGERNAWQAMLNHYVFEENGDPAEHLQPHDPGILGTMSPAMVQHIHRWLVQELGPPGK